MLSRRRFLQAVSASMFAAPLVAEAQQARKVPRIAFISTTSPGTSPATEAFREGLRSLGYAEGQNITVEWRWGRGTTERFVRTRLAEGQAVPLGPLRIRRLTNLRPRAGWWSLAAVAIVSLV